MSGEGSGAAERMRRAALAGDARTADRIERLHAVAAALQAAVSPRDVAGVLAARGACLPGVASCAVALAEHAREWPRVTALRGAAAAPGGVVVGEPVEAPALLQALRERRLRYLSAADGWDALQAEAAAWGFSEGATRGLVELPLVAGDQVLGALALAFVAPERMDEPTRTFLDAFADQGAIALERASLYEAERAARLEAQHAAEVARRAIELQERLVAVVGHDLRTPLSAIRLATGLLLQRGGLTPSQARVLERLGVSAARMTAIIRDLLDFTRLRNEGGIPVARQVTDLAELARRAVLELAAVHADREIALLSDGPALVHGDPERLTQVLSNLVGNALQYGPRGTPVEVRVSGAERSVWLEVHNLGPAIPPDALPDIFEPFRRGVQGADPSGSLGLGLFIVRELVHAHAGEVEVTSSPGAGTTFTVRLPRPRPPAVPTGQPATQG
ncbi:MAG: HAMP domain-containing sensor histidine kinase [Anaeromyxobacter sp.]